MLRLILARHGNTFEPDQTPRQIGARTDLPLTSAGRAQAQALASHLQPQHPIAIYTGLLQRQKETAAILARALSCPIHTESALTEIDYGQWENLTAEEISRRWPQEYHAWTTSGAWANQLFGKTLPHHLAQIEQWLHRLPALHPPNATIIAISSNGLLRFFHPQWRHFAATHQMETLKVKTGHYCELSLNPHSIHSWNAKP